MQFKSCVSILYDSSSRIPKIVVNGAILTCEEEADGEKAVEIATRICVHDMRQLVYLKYM
jgi:hypothetical protein